MGENSHYEKKQETWPYPSVNAFCLEKNEQNKFAFVKDI